MAIPVLITGGVGYIGESESRPDLYYRNNLYGTRCLFDAMRADAFNHLAFSSSCGTYGVPRSVLINPYGASKWMVECVSDRKISVVAGPRRPGDPAALSADPSRARKILNGSAQYPDLDSMIQTAFDWMSRRGGSSARS